MEKIRLLLILSVLFVISVVAQNQLRTVVAVTNDKVAAQNHSKRDSSNTISTGDQTIDTHILNACEKYSVDPMLVYAQMKQESNFKQKAASYKGASGLMQLMPATAIRFGAKNIYDPQQNIDAGVKYMRWLLDEFDGDTKLALAAYNAGEGSVKKYDNQIPPYRETQNYVARITAHYEQIKNMTLVRIETVANQEIARSF